MREKRCWKREKTYWDENNGSEDVTCDGEDLGMLKMEVRNGGRKEGRGTTTFTKTRKK